uniref:BTB domain-containing protein n=1 Tax=Chromera velia CCMP2878 TaxID=1169474 RepID=A0A0G4HA37_9ALVE|eukprot:Cvel_25430.t1-p1 / transcript=Cvel_25430.t1 / gene=Cvel_25430 / organism=Chromera_velia_CCMP2878 / gene_product=hypothetical protein / transcript_product=hypothetical protein / location=Cvel_scaffold2880:9803-11069(-) / protein_length=375 / sequence_SO=supercontig / SO=protein_coding / is_pseudo=false
MVTASGFVARLPSIPMTHADDPIRIDGIEAKAENIELFLGWVHGELPLDLKVGTETFIDILVIVDFFEATDLASKIATALKGNLEVQMPLAKESIEAACDVAKTLKDRVAEYILHHTTPTGRGREKSLNDIMVMNDMLKFFRLQDLKEASPASMTATRNYTAKLLKKAQKDPSIEDLQAKDLLFFGSTPTGGANSDPVFGSRSLRSEWKACRYSLEAKTYNHSTKVNIPLFLPESGISLVRPKKANRVPVSFAGREELPSSSESDEEEALLSGGRGRVSVSTTNTTAFFSVHCKISAIGSHCRLILRDGNGGQLQIMRSNRDLTDIITNPASLHKRGVFCVNTSDESVWIKKFEQGSQFHFAGGLSLQNTKECLI